MNVVAIFAHQDDEMRCLGTMLKCRARGDKLFFITLTDGSKGFVQNPTIDRAEAAAIRDQEMRDLASHLGAEYINIAELDEFLYDTPEVRMKLIEAIRQTGADLIFTHYKEDYNQDHITTHDLVLHCAMQSCLPVLATPSEPLVRHPAVFMVEPFGAFHFPATYYVDITDYQTEKIELLRLHASQEIAMQQAVGAGMEKLCTGIALFRGEQVGCTYAEAFAPMLSRGALKPYPVLP
ncbi:PIG-L family deacetylase [Phototrophicus methaneseepsis]|uniref:PIG-L family deacetylase n=1 Tax=Phototrophicus methaneseepsis TaxID=2710758 RepID=A0A7S8IG17_9CHLR|nr:PIG-L deacetylase family protein [Phototrophicus methaneseepsis]QPC84177.1 PIG-L family deacetylase [Phototrophicus methaneseepsis]